MKPAKTRTGTLPESVRWVGLLLLVVIVVGLIAMFASGTFQETIPNALSDIITPLQELTP